MKKYYTQKEIILCTYLSMYEENDTVNISNIGNLTHRSLDSIKMKIQNIAAMLDEASVNRYNNVAPLTGLPRGKSGRKTNWDIVESVYKLPKQEFFKKCQSILLELL